MRFGVREIANVVFKAKSNTKIGTTTFKAGQPVLYLDSATTATLEGSATTVYARGGRGNTKLLAWEGEKEVTFTVEDALLSPIGFSILSGAGLIKTESSEQVHVHLADYVSSDADGKIDVSTLTGSSSICTSAPIFVSAVDDNSVGEAISGVSTENDDDGVCNIIVLPEGYENGTFFVDFYVLRDGSKVSELQIDAENFAGYYYVEGETLFRRESTGVDMPAILTFPRVKIQSNFTFSLAATGDPSTFSFVMDAFPDYTYFNKTRKVLCVIQIIEDADEDTDDIYSVMSETGTGATHDSDILENDSIDDDTTGG